MEIEKNERNCEKGNASNFIHMRNITIAREREAMFVVLKRLVAEDSTFSLSDFFSLTFVW
jgi:hypothetical protein